MEIKIDDLTGPEVADLLNQHIQSMKAHSPPESKHALDLDALRKPEITFWSAWESGELVGCVAIMELDHQHGEIKSMKTHPDHLRKGIAKQLLHFIIEESNKRGYSKLSLETGAMDAFRPAQKLYEDFGFEYCEPFSDYKKDPNSVFMRRML